jgi:sugar lactone lactonase YvrE
MRNQNHGLFVVLLSLFCSVSAADELFKATPLTKPGEFTKGIEGPACDKAGNVFAVNFKKQGTIGRVSLDGKAEIFLSFPEGSIGNGIEVSPDGKTLYVNESRQRSIWAFSIKKNGSVEKKRLFRKFEDHGFDGMRCDAKGNLYVTRHGKGTVVILSPEGIILKEVDVLGARPTNLCFGGPDGRTVYVTEVEHTRIVQFRVEHPGLSWTMNQ